MKKLMLMVGLSGCAMAQSYHTQKCPTTPALVADTALIALPLYSSVNAYVRGDYATTIFSLLVAGSLTAADVLLVETCPK